MALMDRSQYVGSSDAAAILGLSPWKSAYSVYEAKRGLEEVDLDPEREVRLRRGTRFEPLILDSYQEESGAWIVARNERYVDHQYSFLASEVDAEEKDEQTGEITNLEIKSVSAYAAKHFGEQGTDEVPIHYVAQIQFALMVTGRKCAKLVALIGTDDLRVYLIPRDEEIIAHIRQRAVDFWNNNVLAKVPPPIQTAEDAAKMIRAFDGLTVAANEETVATAEALKRVRSEQKLLKSRCEELETQLKVALALGEPSGTEPKKFALVDQSGKPIATWNLISRAGYTVAPTEYRVLRIA